MKINNFNIELKNMKSSHFHSIKISEFNIELKGVKNPHMWMFLIPNVKRSMRKKIGVFRSRGNNYWIHIHNAFLRGKIRYENQ